MARRRIKVASFRGEDVELEFPNGDVYPIRGDLPMEILIHLAELDEEAQDGHDETAAFADWYERGKRLVLGLIREKTPGAPDSIVGSPQELMGIMGAIAGGESVGVAVAQAMQAGMERAHEGLTLDGEEAPPLDPTPPRTSSGARSSGTSSRRARPSSARS